MQLRFFIAVVVVAIDMPNYAVRLSEEREEEPPQPTAASQGLGSQAHLMDKSHMWPRGEKRQRRGSGSAEGDGDASERDFSFILDKNNVSIMFSNSGNNVDPDRLEVFANNLFLADVHMFAVTEAQENIIVMIENIGEYRVHRVPNSTLVCFCHIKYYNNFSLQAHEGTVRSKYGIFRSEWDGRVGGTSETVLTAFHLHHEEAKKEANQDYSIMQHIMNAFFHDFGKGIIRRRARIVMGEANMGCYAVEDVLAHQGLSASLLAFHAEYLQPKDVIDKHKKSLRQLKWDRCSIWSIGPIEKINMQGPAKHCLAAALWPQRVDGRGTFMVCVQKSYRRVVPHSEMVGKDKWPHLTEDIF